MDIFNNNATTSGGLPIFERNSPHDIFSQQKVNQNWLMVPGFVANDTWPVETSPLKMDASLRASSLARTSDNANGESTVWQKMRIGYKLCEAAKRLPPTYNDAEMFQAPPIIPDPISPEGVKQRHDIYDDLHRRHNKLFE